jgi:hypothetical protein
MDFQRRAIRLSKMAHKLRTDHPPATVAPSAGR